MEVCVSKLKESPFADQLDWVLPEPISPAALHRVHTPEYRNYIEEACLRGKPFADTGDTVICPDSYKAALLAAGAAADAVDSVLDGKYDRALSVCRPPGHHANSEQAMGFCLFNNVAIAAAHATARTNIDRVCIVDWDVHHGNGTQDIFWSSPNVLFLSTHQLPLYPHSGGFFEKGSGAGLGTTCNRPVPPKTNGFTLLPIYLKEFSKAIDAFQPDLLLISAGFDAHRKDPLAELELEVDDFRKLTQWAVGVATRNCHGRLVSLLEGGYHLEALGESICAHAEELLKDAG